MVKTSWDEYFYAICNAVSSKSPCLSRQIGAILVCDHSIVSTGYNGPPRGIPHCEGDICPRKAKGFASGEGMELCDAQHAEENAVTNAARNGVITIGTTLYMNSVIPCHKCFGTLINAGIAEVVIGTKYFYSEQTQRLLNHSQIKIREFNLP